MLVSSQANLSCNEIDVNNSSPSLFNARNTSQALLYSKDMNEVQQKQDT